MTNAMDAWNSIVTKVKELLDEFSKEINTCNSSVALDDRLFMRYVTAPARLIEYQSLVISCNNFRIFLETSWDPNFCSNVTNGICKNSETAVQNVVLLEKKLIALCAFVATHNAINPDRVSVADKRTLANIFANIELAYVPFTDDRSFAKISYAKGACLGIKRTKLELNDIVVPSLHALINVAINKIDVSGRDCSHVTQVLETINIKLLQISNVSKHISHIQFYDAIGGNNLSPEILRSLQTSIGELISMIKKFTISVAPKEVIDSILAKINSMLKIIVYPYFQESRIC